MDTMQRAVLSADLRDALIPCGDCADEDGDMATVEQHEQANATEIKQLAGLLSGWQQSMSFFQGQIETQMRDSREDIKTLFVMVKEQADIINKTYSKVTNGQEDRLKKAEEAIDKLPDNYVRMEVFNGAMGALRSQMQQLKWIFGLGFTAVCGLLAALLVL